jgi:hypothetical protein
MHTIMTFVFTTFLGAAAILLVFLFIVAFGSSRRRF